jgi:hypothetical protein
MTILSAYNTPRNTYTASASQTSFAISFEFYQVADIKVYKNGTLLTYNATPSTSSQYKITGTPSPSDDAYEFGQGGTITLGAGANVNDIIVIIRDISIERTTDFNSAGAFDITALNTQLDTLTSVVADIKTQTDRSVKLLDTDIVSATVTLPDKATRQSKILGFDANGNAETSISSTGLGTLSAITGDITIVAGIAADVTTVASNDANVTTVGTNIGSVNTVATNIADIITVANDLNEAVSEVETVADDLNEAISEIDTVSNNITDVQTVGDATNIANITTVAGATPNINTVAGQISPTNNILTVANANANIATVAGDSANIALVAGAISPTNNIATVATNIAGINSFGERYRVSATAPTTSLDLGDLYFDTTSDTMKVYSSGGFINAGSSVNGTADRFKYTATASQVTFTGPDDNTSTLAYDAGFLDVYLNGIKLVNGTDFTASNGTSIVLATGASVSDILEVVAYGTFQLANFSITDATDVPPMGTVGQILQVNSGATALEFATLQGGNITTEGEFFSNYNTITANATSTVSATVNAVLFGPITVNSGITWTISGTLGII